MLQTKIWMICKPKTKVMANKNNQGFPSQLNDENQNNSKGKHNPKFDQGQDKPFNKDKGLQSDEEKSDGAKQNQRRDNADDR